MEGQIALILVTQLTRIVTDALPGSLDKMIAALTVPEGVTDLTTRAAGLEPASQAALQILQICKAAR